MPIEPKKTGDAAAGNNGGRTNFRPPWVKEGPKPIPMPTAPWTLNKRGSIAKDNEGPPPDAPTGRKSSTIKIVPAQPAENGTTSNTKDPHVFERPKLREVPKAPPKEQKLQSREVKVPISMTSTRRDSKDLPQKVHIDTKNPHKVELKPVSKDESKKKDEPPPKVELKPVKVKETDKDGPLDKAVPSERNKIVRQESMKKVCPAPPPMPPMPPPPPPPQIPFERRESLTRVQLEKLESLRSRPRKRPDWGAMMKDIENGKKLKKVECNDRSQPLLPQNKAKGQFIYESEKANLHNQLLKQIQTGAQLKHVKTNDRSKPILQGLRKFRRQMTIEEKIIKSMSIASMPPEEVEEEVDEMDDIDKVRDDLQSTKQMLALELRNKEAQIAENKRLLARLANLEAELEKFKNAPAPVNQKEFSPAPVSSTPAAPGDDKLVKTLKNEAEEARKTAEQMEKKYHQTADELFTVKNDLDEVKKQNAMLERKLQQTLQGGGQKRQSISDRRESVKQDEDDFSEEEESESEDDGEDNEEKQKRRAEREVRLIRNKLKSIKNKEEAAKRERKNLREMMKKNQQAMKEEKKKYKKLQKEVNKMAALMKDDDDEDDEEKEDLDEEEEEEETETESETESESESSEEESESESEDEDAPNEDKKENLNARIKHHENSLNVVKKGNYMLKANVDRLQDDLNKQKEMVQSLQEDLDSVLAELG